jgi:multidrug transporter EmrE-like cation transporter
LKLTLFIVWYAVAMAASSVLLRFASQSHGLHWWGYFAAANVVGFSCVVALPFALKLAPSNLVFALSMGCGFCLVQFALWWFFREPISTWQWVGLVFITLGILFLQIKT